MTHVDHRLDTGAADHGFDPPLEESGGGCWLHGGTSSPASAASRAGRPHDSTSSFLPSSASVNAFLPDREFTAALFDIGALVLVPVVLSLIGVGVGYVAATLLMLVALLVQ